MRNIILATIIFAFGAAPVFSAEEKKVCVNQTDAKTKKSKEVCKTVKVHKKLEGTKVPAK